MPSQIQWPSELHTRHTISFTIQKKFQDCIRHRRDVSLLKLGCWVTYHQRAVQVVARNTNVEACILPDCAVHLFGPTADREQPDGMRVLKGTAEPFHAKPRNIREACLRWKRPLTRSNPLHRAHHCG